MFTTVEELNAFEDKSLARVRPNVIPVPDKPPVLTKAELKAKSALTCISTMFGDQNKGRLSLVVCAMLGVEPTRLGFNPANVGEGFKDTREDEYLAAIPLLNPNNHNYPLGKVHFFLGNGSGYAFYFNGNGDYCTGNHSVTSSHPQSRHGRDYWRWATKEEIVNEVARVRALKFL